jgi:H+/Cl- antiporter ClcA
VSDHLLFGIVGFVIGFGGSMIVAQSFIAERGSRKVLPIAIPLGLVIGLVLAWALNGWNDWVHASATTGM